MSAFATATERGVAIVTLDVPGEPVNTLSPGLADELRLVLDRLAADGEVRAVVLISGKPDSFIAGADIDQFARLRTQADAESLSRDAQAMMDRVAAFRKPVVAAIHGACLGGGCELALSCDLIVASETAQFGQPETGLGIIPGAGGTQRLTRAVGKALAMDVILSGRRLSAREALAAGLVARVVAKEAWLDEAKRVARDIAEKGPVATRLAKESVDRAYETTLAAGLEAERRALYLSFASEDAKEGLTAFTEKRKPEFKGR